jgi:hypothetical protein
MKRERWAVAMACSFVAWAGAPPAHAESPSETTAVASTPEIAPRPWLYLDDPSLPTVLRAVVSSRATYTSGPSPTRPFGANLARPGGILEVGGEVGLLKHLSLAASVLGGGQEFGIGALAGLRWAPFEGHWKTTHAVVSGGWLHELDRADDGAWVRIALTEDIERLRLGATVHGEHVFASGRDPVDVLVMAGASYALAGPVRAGLEYVAQDLEESLGDQAEGGARHFLGPQMALELLDKRLSIAGGPAFGLGPQSPTLSGRLSLAYEY